MYLDWQKNDVTYIAIDVETDGLDAIKIWVACWENIKSGEKGTIHDYQQLRAFLDGQPQAVFVGHNILKFDAPVLNRIVGSSLSVEHLCDTLVLCTLYNPSLAGGHSLEAWGDRLGGEQKVKHEDWSKLSTQMVERCQSDVRMLVNLFKRITQVLNKIGFSEQSCWIQHRIIDILRVQQNNGFYFNGPEAINLHRTLQQKQEELREAIYHAFPPELKLISSYKTGYKQNGERTAHYLNHLKTFELLRERDDGGYDAFGRVDFNLGSSVQRTQKLIDLGWKPQEFTPKGNPQPFQKGELALSLAQFLEDKEVPEVEMIAKWMMFNSIGGMINTWLDNWNEETGCIHGEIFVADTLRFRHQKPNTANVPAIKTRKDGTTRFEEDGYYTYESRNLWRARPKRVLVGTDATALEYRMLAHYVNNPQLTDVVLNSDVHAFTQEMAGLATRANAKTLNFAIIYGSGDAKTGRIVGGGSKKGAELKAKLYQNIPGLGDAISEATAEFDRGRISLVDGSQIVCPARHAAFNYKLQGGGARVMARAAIFLDEAIHRHGLDSLKVGDIHDEWQYDVHPRDAAEHARLSVYAIQEAGEELNLRIAMDGKATEGLTWAQTH